MLDFRHETFLTLCKIKSYTKTAQALCITQPAVSQHIKYLEQCYGGKLFYYAGKTLTLTERGKQLYDFAMTIHADCQHMVQMLSNETLQARQISFGATLSIGEYVMPPIMTQLITVYPDLHINMQVDNTQVLLRKLRDGKIQFALVEGFFDKSQYDWKLFSKERFVPVCGANHPLAGKTIPFHEILNHRLILREHGSGTRDVFEQLLAVHNLSVTGFQRICEIGNMSVIKQLVSNHLGISFLYEASVKQELEQGSLVKLQIEGFEAEREFQFVYLKNSLHEAEYLNWFAAFAQFRTA